MGSYLRSNDSVRDELDTVLRVGEGALPDRLRGVLYRNGPGKVEVFGTKYSHPFDGDGMVARFAFDGHAVRYRNRFVRTDEYVAEERARRMLYRSFGTNLPGGVIRNFLRLRFKNAANTSVILHGGKLLALWEGGLPHRLDPVTLDTLGRYDFDGALANRTGRLSRWMSPDLPFSAHPKLDLDSGELVNFGTLMGAKNRLVSYRVRRDGVMSAPSFTNLESLCFVHDFVLTKHYCVYFLSAVSFRVGATLAGLATPVGSLSGASDAAASILVVPRDGRSSFAVPAAPGFVFHFANGYEDARGFVVLDGMRMPSLPSASDVQKLLDGEDVNIPSATPTRYLVDPVGRTVSETALTSTPADLPTIDPRFVGRQNRHFWAVAGEAGNASPLAHRILHFDHEGPHAERDFGVDFPGEPLFVPTSPDAKEGEGWILSLVYRVEAHRSDLYILRASDLATECRVELPHHNPPGFHGVWCPSLAS